MSTRQTQLRDGSADAHTATGAAGEQGALTPEDARAQWLARLPRGWAVADGAYPPPMSRVVLGGLFLFTRVPKSVDSPRLVGSILAHQRLASSVLRLLAS